MKLLIESRKINLSKFQSEKVLANLCRLFSAVYSQENAAVCDEVSRVEDKLARARSERR